MDEMKPCPFCGGEPTIEHPEGDDYAVGCDDCCFSIMAGNVGIGWYATREEAITAWNTRPREDAGVVDDAMVERAWKAYNVRKHALDADDELPLLSRMDECMKAALAAALGRPE